MAHFAQLDNNNIVINIIVFAVGTLVTVTGATLLYQMFRALFD